MGNWFLQIWLINNYFNNLESRELKLIDDEPREASKRNPSTFQPISELPSREDCEWLPDCSMTSRPTTPDSVEEATSVADTLADYLCGNEPEHVFEPVPDEVKELINQ